MESDEEKSFCYIEGAPIDKTTTKEITELHENVWFRTKPPKPSSAICSPSVSARQIDFIRNILLGKNALKTDHAEAEKVAAVCPNVDEEASCRREVIEKPSIRTKKSSVRFLTEKSYE